jgi:DNA-binding NarL/FixJ family response regulator
VLMVSSHEDLHFVRASFSAGARGFLTKSDVFAELAVAIRQVYSDETYVSKGLRMQERKKIQGSVR